ncbi:MAG: hypothetical protein ACJA0T_002211 [Colwellia sp.]|jgi:hypothetical protein
MDYNSMRELNMNEMTLVFGGTDEVIRDAESELGKTINDLEQLRQKAIKALADWMFENF